MAPGEGGPGRRAPAAADALLLGAALGAFHAALPPLLTALFWPRISQALLLLSLVGGGVAALCAAALRGRWDRVPRRVSLGRWGALVAAASSTGAWAATDRVAASLLPGSGLGLGAFPLPYLAVLAAPHAAAGAALAGWAGRGERRRIALFLVAGGAVFAAVTHLGGERPGRVRLAEQGESSLGVSVDRGLREDVVAPPRGAGLPFRIGPGEDGHVEILMVGFPNGPILEELLGDARARLTVFEDDAALVAEVTGRWPELGRAAAQGRLSVRPGSPRWFLERTAQRFDLIVLAENWSYAAHLSRALAPRREYRYTVESLRACIGRLDGGGLLVVQRAGIGRVVTTLREAYGAGDPTFAEKLVVLGEAGRIVSQCWFSPAGFVDRARNRQLGRHVRATGAGILYRPSKRWRGSFYYQIVTGRRVRGLYFSTPFDLSPTRDARPFFDHMERLVLSPSAGALPDELDAGAGARGFRLVPASDRPLWFVLLLGLAVAAAGVALGLARGRGPRGSGELRRDLSAVLPTALFLGASAALGLEAFAGWAEWLSPSRGVAPAALACAVCAAGLALAPRLRAGGGVALAALAGVLALFGLAGYRLAPAVPRLGPGASVAAILLGGIALGAVAAHALRAACAELGDRAPRTASWAAAAGLASFAAAAPAARLLAAPFGYPLLWALAAAAALAALRRRRFLPAAPAA